jgi:hypothetical protein
VWLAIAPWVLGYTPEDAVWNPVLCGGIVVVLAIVRIAAGPLYSDLSRVNAAFGLWVFASAFWLTDSGQAFWNSVIVGLIVFALGLFSAAAGDASRQG